MYKKILVTGGTGIIGTAIKAISHEYQQSEFIFVGSKDCNLIKFEETLQFVEMHQPDAIIHTAAIAGGIQYSQKYPATLLRDNVLLNNNILEAARLHKVEKVIMTLSVGMYPTNAPHPLREEYIHDGNPHETNYSYAFAKRLVEPSIKAYRAEYDMGVIGLVPNGIFGENMNFRYEEAVMVGALIRRFYENRDSNEEIFIWGDGSPLREYTYSQDLARAFMWGLGHYNEPQILNVGSTEEHSVKETAYLIAEMMNIDKERVVFDTSKPAGVPRRNTDNSKFVSLSGFQYTPFRIGLERTIRWFSENYAKPGQVRL